jgi:RHH-type proline utilization regulon transcriptional repressor/proline dehydrogenase/delta 1-pyrroline-5-carboxylate dehydrogenase
VPIAEDAPAGLNGLGFMIQTCHERCLAMADLVVDLARRSGRRPMVRLVKGACWDAEIERGQLDGQTGYPVFTRKVCSELACIACAKRLLGAPARRVALGASTPRASSRDQSSG